MLVEIVTTAALHALKRRGGTTRQLRLLSAPVSVDETTISETIRADDMATIHVGSGVSRDIVALTATILREMTGPPMPTIDQMFEKGRTQAVGRAKKAS